jgi:hypothetical protein
MGMSGSRLKTVQVGMEGPVERGLVSCSGRAPETGRNCLNCGPVLPQHNDDRALAAMLLDSFHIPRVLPPRLAALVVLLKTLPPERRRGARENDPPIAA